ncbi:ATP-dependent (S)-NAD(P)H-hydrate dehydratase [Candida viswanathii]|uniref:ATP-dependent (S)-NAD(P)H-hydrate dehydratase n=1 Tax=Candida viswanathii TaxID=5486 RepID=A0A367XYP9_9ASCO|nr:ATP-dependent (S)-NAD(P)H-hydrate dehydratase [Candida viswanathii]
MLRGKSQKELIHLSRQLIQPLLPSFHKGQSGKIAVIGGNEDYTGAPFFSSHSAALVGADLSHVICEKAAAPVIKSYTPDLMVHPYLVDLNNPAVKLSDEELDKLKQLPIDEVIKTNDNAVLNKIIDELVLPKVMSLLNRIDIVVVGPGFGRDPLMLKSLVRIIEEIKVLNLPIVLDADSLFLLSTKPQLISNYPKAIITPNVVEFQRIAKALSIEVSLSESDKSKMIEQTQEVSKKLGDVIVFRKGEQDIIVKADTYLINEVQGSNKRVGGQGDTLTGAIATLVNWSNNYILKVWDNKVELGQVEANLLACYAASSLVRCACNKAFKKYGRSMQTSNIHEFLHDAFVELFDDSLLFRFSNI